MSFIELPNMDDITEPKAAPEATYPLCIIDAKFNEKEGSQTIRVIMEIEDQEEGDNFANVFHYLALPGPDDDAEKRKVKLLFAKRFFELFEIDYEGGIETDQMVGQRADCALNQALFEQVMRNNLVLPPFGVEVEDQAVDPVAVTDEPEEARV